MSKPSSPKARNEDYQADDAIRIKAIKFSPKKSHVIQHDFLESDLPG